MKKILIYNSGGGLRLYSIISFLISLQNHFKRSTFYYLGAHENHFGVSERV